MDLNLYALTRVWEKRSMLSEDQQRIVDAIRRRKQNVLMTGPGGVGKSFVITHVSSSTTSCVTTAMTGAAAILIGGNTLHSALGIGLGTASVDEMVRRECNKKVLREMKLLIIDEVSMLSAQLLDKLELVARRIRKSDLPFGGIQLLLSGDFLQLPTINNEFCFHAKCWSSLKLNVFELTEIRRQIDPEFQRVLNLARIGKITSSEVDYLQSGGSSAYDNGLIPTKIFCKNIDVDNINDRELSRLAGVMTGSTQTFTYEMEIVGDIRRPYQYCNAPPKITLAVGAQVMMLVNCKTNGLVNGSRGVVTKFIRDFPVVRFSGCETIISFHDWEVKHDKTIIGHIYALPLKLAWAITCHKAQGATLDSALIDLNGVFEYGQAYVAISRVKSHESLVLKNAAPELFRAHPEAKQFYGI